MQPDALKLLTLCGSVNRQDDIHNFKMQKFFLGDIEIPVIASKKS